MYVLKCSYLALKYHFFIIFDAFYRKIYELQKLVFSMVTKLDVFQFLYKRGSVVQPKEVVANFQRSDKEYNFMYHLLLELVRAGLVIKSKHGFEVKVSEKTRMLHQMMLYSLSNKINYNELFKKDIASFIQRCSFNKKFSFEKSHLHPRTFSKYVDILSKSGLLILLSRKPLVGIIPYNSFLYDMVKYFGRSARAESIRNDEYLDDIRRELRLFNRMKKSRFVEYQHIVEGFEMSFIHHSLSLEGNPMTLPDTVQLLRENVVPSNVAFESVEEVKNYERAMKKMMVDALQKSPLTKTTILGYHYLAMLHRSEIAGKIRTLPVHIRGNQNFKVASVGDIEKNLDVLLEKYAGFTKKNHQLKDVLEFASFFHNEFQHIHPFEDGNSRITRLLTFHLLTSQSIPIFDIPLGLLEQYLKATKGTLKRKDSELYQILQLIILYNVKTMNEKMK